MQGQFKLADVALSTNKPAEVLALLTLATETSYDELAFRQPNVTNYISRDQYNQLVSDCAVFGARMGVLDINTLEVKPKIDLSDSSSIN